MSSFLKRFDWIAAGLEVGPDALSDVPVLSTSAAVVLPTLGSIVPNWVLVVPRMCAGSISALPEEARKSLLTLGDTAARTMRSQNAVFFEHGPGRDGGVVGCGVDQAHLHVVSTEFEFTKSALADPTVEWQAVGFDDPWAGLYGKEYYLLRTAEFAFVGYPRSPISQFFRRHIAAAAGIPEQWNYKEWPHYDNIRRTYEQFGCVRTDAN